MKNNKKMLSIIFPVYQNGENLSYLYKEIIKFKKELNDINLELIFIDDGSTDNSFEEMKKIRDKSGENTILVQFTRNFGQASALNCGWKLPMGTILAIFLQTNKTL